MFTSGIYTANSLLDKTMPAMDAVTKTEHENYEHKKMIVSGTIAIAIIFLVVKYK